MDEKKELKRNFERLQLMQEVSQYHATSVQDLLDFALDKVIALSDSKFGYIYHYCEGTQEFVLNTWSKGVMESCAVVAPQSIYQLEMTGLWGEVVRQRQPLLVNDYSAHSPLKKGCPAGHVQLSRFMSLPIIDNEQIVAVVGVANKETPYDQADILQLTLMMEGVWKIVARLDLEEKIISAAHQWQGTFDAISDSVALLDADQRIVRCNLATAKLLNKGFDEIIHQPCWKIFHGSETPIEGCPTELAKISRHSEKTTIKEDGRWLEVTVDPILADGGELTGAVHIVRDVTALKTAEDDLRRNRELLAATARIARMGGWEIDLETNRLSWTEEIYRIHEVDENFQPTLERAIAFYAPESLPLISVAVKQAIEEHKEFDLELKVITAAGNNRLVHSVGHVAIKDGKAVKVYGTFQDITEERLAEESLQKMQAQLLQSEKLASIGLLSAGVAHEINNPMSFISSNMFALGNYIEKYHTYIAQVEAECRSSHAGVLPDSLKDLRATLKLDYVMADISTLLVESGEGIERVKQIVQDLKTFSRTDNSIRSLVDLNHCMESAINIITNEIKYTAELKRDYALLPEVFCNAQQVSQVLMNLLINATHAIQSKGEELGEIVVRTWSDDENVYLSVTDSGCGIAPEAMSRIFDPFFTTKVVGKGTGLGLSISNEIIRKHGGLIRVESQPGNGSTFLVQLPLIPPPHF